VNRWRLLVAEALLLLVLARLLVAGPRFGMWRRWLGLVGQSVSGDPIQSDWQLACAVERARQWLPGQAKCLPQAMALHWMLRRRRRPSVLVIATLPGALRGNLDDLHAWVEIGQTVMIGQSDQPFRPLASFGHKN
jgi:hypothetical protein